MLSGEAEGSPYRRHVPALDGVRGVAILGVMLAHLFVSNAKSPVGRSVQTALGFGGVGVVLFFVLSGFLITGILVDSVGEPHFFRVFYVRRMLRIFPLYYAVLLGFAIAVWTGHAAYGGELRSLAVYVQNTNLAGPAIWYYSGPSHLPLMHFWTLAVEEQFYLVWPLAVFALKSRRDVFCASVVGAGFSVLLRSWLVMHGATDTEVHGMTFCRLDTLLLGGALAMLVRSRWHERAVRLGPWLFLGGTLLAVACDQLGPFAPYLAFVWLTLSYFSYAVLCAGLLMTALGVAKPVFSAAWLRWFGKYSYGLYVFHYMLNGFWSRPVRLWLRAHGLGDPAAVVAVSGLAIGLASVAAAVLSFKVFERRFLKLKRYVPYQAVAR